MLTYAIKLNKNVNGELTECLGSFSYFRLDSRLCLANQIKDVHTFRKDFDMFKIITCPKLGYNEKIIYIETEVNKMLTYAVFL